MKYGSVELIVGLVVIVLSVVFVGYAYRVAGGGPQVEGYELVGRFDKADGLNVGSDVLAAGIKVGQVIDMQLDKETFEALVRIRLDSGVRLTEDASARITSNGLLGDNYISLETGGFDTYLEAGDEITYTRGSVDLFGLIGAFVGGGGGDEEEDER